MKSLIDGFLNRTPVSYASARSPVSVAGAMRRTSMSKTDQLAAMAAMGTIFAIVTKTASGSASVTWKLYRKSASGKPEDRVEVTRHAALDLWNKPNPFMTRQEFVEVTQQHVDLAGESEWVIRFDNRGFKLPLEMWPVRPDKIEPVPSATDFLAGWLYTDPDGDRIPLSVEEVIQIRSPNPLDPYRGLGPVQTVLVDIAGADAAAQWNTNFFRNSAIPGGMIEMPGISTDDDFDLMRDRWNTQHRGTANAHRVAILEGGAKWVDRSYSQKDMDFTSLREVSREIVREAFGFPKPLLGSVDDVNRANAEAGEYVFAKWLLVPRLDRLKGALNNDLLPLYGATGEGLEFDYCSPVPDDQAADSAALTAATNAAVALVGAGFAAPDVLQYLGLPQLGYTKPAPSGQIGASA